jgi:hypothetical protein
VFVSDLARAVQTAELAFGDRAIPIHFLFHCHVEEHMMAGLAGLVGAREPRRDGCGEARRRGRGRAGRDVVSVTAGGSQDASPDPAGSLNRYLDG